MLYAVKTINWKAFFLLWLGGLLGVVSALPYLFALLKRSTIGQAAVPEVPLSVLVLFDFHSFEILQRESGARSLDGNSRNFPLAA